MNRFGVFLIFILLGAIIVSMGADAKQFTTAFPLVTNESDSQYQTTDVPIAKPHALTDFPVVAPDSGDNGSAIKPTGAHSEQNASSQPQSPEMREARRKPASAQPSEKAVKQPAARPGTSTASPTPRPRSTAKERPPKSGKKPAAGQHGGNSPNVCNPQKSPNRVNCDPQYTGGKQQSPDNHRRQY